MGYDIRKLRSLSASEISEDKQKRHNLEGKPSDSSTVSTNYITHIPRVWEVPLPEQECYFTHRSPPRTPENSQKKQNKVWSWVTSRGRAGAVFVNTLQVYFRITSEVHLRKAKGQKLKIEKRWKQIWALVGSPITGVTMMKFTSASSSIPSQINSRNNPFRKFAKSRSD